MNIKELWTDNKKAIITTALCAFIALLVIKLFDVILVWGIVIAGCVAAVVAWQHYSKKYGGAAGIWKVLADELGGGSSRQ